MTANTRNKALSIGLKGILGIALTAGMLSLAAPAANAAGWRGGWGWHGGGWGWGPGFALGVGVGCCWGNPWWPGYYPYSPYYPYTPTPYVAYPIDPPAGSGVSLASPYVQQALAAPVGQSVTWTDGSSHGAITTTRDGWAGQNYCRQFTEEVTIDGSNTQQRVGTACHAPNGNWRLVPNQS